MNTIYGNLELLSSDDAAWFARAQSFFFHFQEHGSITTFGGIPGKAEPYGYCAADDTGYVYTVLNPSQAFVTVNLPMGECPPALRDSSRLLFRDAGFVPALQAGTVTLGPEQLAVVGFGAYAEDIYDLGVQDDVVIPRAIQPLAYSVESQTAKAVRLSVPAPADGSVLIMMRQLSLDGTPYRTKGGAPPTGVFMADILKINASQNGLPCALRKEYNKQIWCGLSWAAGIVDADSLAPGIPLVFQCDTEEQADVRLEPVVYHISW
jgi:hypothetical protein